MVVVEEFAVESTTGTWSNLHTGAHGTWYHVGDPASGKYAMTTQH
jgi:hypothetical protein